MFRWLIGSSLRFRFLFAAAAAALVVFGTVRLRDMPVDVLPEFMPPVVEVQTEALGLSAEEVENLVTLNTEELLSGLPWLESIRSQSVTGMSSTLITFERGTDIMKARQMVQERLTLAYLLPNVSSPPVILQPLSATNRLMMVGLSSETIDPKDLSLLARWTMKPRLLGVAGVANVAIWGQKLPQMQVHIDPDRLRDARVTQDDIITAAGDALWVSPLTFLRGSTPGTGGWIDNPNQRLGIHHAMPIRQPEDMAKIAVTPPHLLMTGRSMAIGDVAEVRSDHAPLIGDAIVNGGQGLILVIEKFPGANTLEVTRGVEQALGELGRGLPGVRVDPTIFRLASYVDESIGNVSAVLVAAAVLALITIGIFLFDWKAALVSMAAAALSYLAALIALNLAGATMNVMVLVGLVVAIGVVVDDAVVDVQRLLARLPGRAEEGGASTMSLVYETALGSRASAIYPTLVILLGVAPVFFMGGLSGAFFEPMATAYAVAVAASMLVALTVTPMLALMLLGRGAVRRTASPVAEAIRGRYETVLRRIVAAPRAAVATAAVLVAVGLGLWPLLGQSLLPTLKERQLLVSWETAPGTSHAETLRIASRASGELRALPGVVNVGAHVGRAVTGDAIVNVNAGQIWVTIGRHADYDRTVAAIRDVVAGYPGVDSSVQGYLREKVGQALTGAPKAVVVRVYGAKRDVLEQKAEDVRKALSGVEGLVDLRSGGQTFEPHIKLAVDLDAASKANVKPGDVRRASSNVFSGITVGYLFEEQKLYDVVVWGAPEKRASLTDIENLLVERSDRRHVRLGDIAKATVEQAPTVIRHDNIANYVDVVANVVGRDLGSINAEIEGRLQRVQFPLEVHPEILGEYAERLDAQRRMLGVAAATLIAAYLLMQACFGSWRHAVLPFASVLAAVAGVTVAALLGGGVVTLGTIVGLLAAVGIAARNAILLVDANQRLVHEGGAEFGPELAMRGARETAVPILTSTLATIAALLPFAIAGQIAGLEIVQASALAVIGGLVFSTPVTLLVLPILYLALGPSRAGREDLDLRTA